MGKRLKDLLINLSISLVSVVIILLFIELVFRLAAPQNLNGTWRTLSEKGYMINKSSWSARHQSGERIINYRFNSNHLRGPEIDEDLFNILVLGDSFTFGWLLEEEDTYIGKLQQYSNLEFPEMTQWLNGGAGGWGLADCKDFLRDYGDEIKPEMVVVYFNADDIGRSVNRALFNHQSALLRFKTSIEYSRLYNWFLENSHLFQWVRLRLIGIAVRQEASGKNGQMVVPETRIKLGAQESLQVAKDLFQTIDTWCDNRDITLVVLTTGWHFTPPEGKLDPEFNFIQNAPLFFDSLGVPYQDISPQIAPVVQANREEYIIGEDHHPNEKAAELIAKNSWELLEPVLDDALDFNN